jgi:hypothetical protein
MVFEPPKDIVELEKLYYGKNKDGKDIDVEAIKSHEKDERNPANYPNGLNPSESTIKNFLSRFGEVKKIPENKNKTPDFEIIGKNTFVEVKSINTVIGDKISETMYKVNIKNENEWIEKINFTLTDIELKRASTPKSSMYVGSIYVDTPQTLGFGKSITNLNFIKKTNFERANLDGLLVLVEQASGNFRNQIPILFSKRHELTILFNEHYPNNELEIRELHK